MKLRLSFPKGGKERKIYGITVKGLVARLSVGDLWNRLEKIVTVHPDMILAFRKFPIFGKAGLANYFLISLKAHMTSYIAHLDALYLQGYDLVWEKDEFLGELLNRGIIYAPLFAKALPGHSGEHWDITG